MKTPKQKTCKFSKCKQKFTPWSSTQQTCHNATCAFGYDAEKKAKKEKLKHKEAKREWKLNDRKTQMNLAQKAFNRYIRMRDERDNCISCDRRHAGQYHAGHYRSVGALPALRFCEDNVHKQCAPCNNHKSGNILEYRINLTRKIGADKVAWLEGEHDAKKYTVEELREIKEKYTKLANQMEV